MKKLTDSEYASYRAAVQYLESLGNITGGYQKTSLKSHPHPEMYLERMQDFLDEIGNPEKGFKYIHITGTAGKGSVSALVHNTLVKCGKKCGLFTSPFTVSTTEKIQVGLQYIDAKTFTEITNWLKPYIDRAMQHGRHGVPSYFELMLSIALVYFMKKKCEYVVLEVGLGGRYDATNIIKKPLVTAITNIGLDHTHILGSRRIDIARDKAGIIKKGSVFLTTEEDSHIKKIFKDACLDIGAVYNDINIIGMEYDERNRLLAGYICTTIGIIEMPGNIGKSPKLPARFEVVERKPLVVIDGAHNPSKIESTLYNLGQLRYRDMHLIVAISADKDWKTMLRQITPLACTVSVTRFNVPGRQSVDPKLLLAESLKYVRRKDAVRLYSDPAQAFFNVRKKLSAQDVLLITGSFYLAGDIRALYCSEETIVRQRNSMIPVGLRKFRIHV